VDGANNLYISDSSNYRIAKVTSTTGLLTRVGIISSPHALTTDPSGTLYAQSGSLQFYKITPNGDTTFYAGGDAVFPGGFSGDGGPAINAVFNTPTALCRDASGNIFIADTGNNRIRKINGTTGIITTVAGNGQSGNTGDNGPAVNAKLSFPHGVATDKSGNLFILGDTSVRKVAADTGTITTVANISTDRGTIIVDASGNIFIADAYRIRRISASTGTVTTIAGGTQFGDSGDGGPAISALFNFGYSDLFPGLAFDSAGNLYISDTWNGRIRVIKAPIP
jgi:hypothetical protein